MTENTLMKHVQLLWNRFGRALRNNNGVAYQGETFHLKNGDVLIKNARQIKFGLGVGTGDLIGFTKLKITMAHVGSEILVFTNIELKSKNGRLTKEQIAFDEFIKLNGGLSFVFKELPEGGKIEETIHTFCGRKKPD